MHIYDIAAALTEVPEELEHWMVRVSATNDTLKSYLYEDAINQASSQPLNRFDGHRSPFYAALSDVADRADEIVADAKALSERVSTLRDDANVPSPDDVPDGVAVRYNIMLGLVEQMHDQAEWITGKLPLDYSDESPTVERDIGPFLRTLNVAVANLGQCADFITDLGKADVSD